MFDPCNCLYIAASSTFAPGIAIKSLTAANGHKYSCEFYLGRQNVAVLSCFPVAHIQSMCTCQQCVYVLSAILRLGHTSRSKL